MVVTEEKWSQTEIQKIPFTCNKKPFLQVWSNSGPGCAQSFCSLCIFILGDTQNPSGHDPW